MFFFMEWEEGRWKRDEIKLFMVNHIAKTSKIIDHIALCGHNKK